SYLSCRWFSRGQFRRSRRQWKVSWLEASTGGGTARIASIYRRPIENGRPVKASTKCYYPESDRKVSWLNKRGNVMPSTTINGLKHYYEDHGSGEVLVMLHGANGSSKGVATHFPGLSQHFRVIAPDMRSMGQSEHVASMPKDGWVQDLLALLDQLGVAQAYV